MAAEIAGTTAAVVVMKTSEKIAMAETTIN
jgi:hypothetical protein